MLLYPVYPVIASHQSRSTLFRIPWVEKGKTMGCILNVSLPPSLSPVKKSLFMMEKGLAGGHCRIHLNAEESQSEGCNFLIVALGRWCPSNQASVVEWMHSEDPASNPDSGLEFLNGSGHIHQSPASERWELLRACLMRLEKVRVVLQTTYLKMLI